MLARSFRHAVPSKQCEGVPQAPPPTPRVLRKHRLGHKPACLVTRVVAPHAGPCPHSCQGLGHRSPASLAGGRSPCLSLSGCVLYETTFLLGLTRDPPHPPMVETGCHTPPWPRRLTPVPYFRKPRQRPGCSPPRPGSPARVSGEPTPGLPAPHPLACLSVQLTWPTGASDSRDRPGCGSGQGLTDR